jgi:hypothetical protein
MGSICLPVVKFLARVCLFNSGRYHKKKNERIDLYWKNDLRVAVTSAIVIASETRPLLLGKPHEDIQTVTQYDASGNVITTTQFANVSSLASKTYGE